MTDTVGNVSAFSYNPYYQNGSYYDFDDLDVNYGAYPMMGADGSIFGSSMGMMPVMGATAGSSQSYFDNMKNYQKFYVDYNIDQQKMQRNADLRVNASLEAVKGTAAMLKDKVVNNEQDQIQEAFERYLAAVKSAYGNGTDSELKARALSLYAQMNGGKTLYQDLRDYGHGSFTQGAIQSMTMGLYDRHCAEDNISEISGAPVGTTDKLKHNAGRLTGAAVVGGGAYGLAKLTKLGGKAGIVGLAAAGAAALMSFITGKVTT